MSLIVAIKEENRIVLGSDSQASMSGNKEHNTMKLWPVKSLPGAVIGGVGLARASQIIQFCDIIDKNCISDDITTEYIVRSFIPMLVNALTSNGINTESEKSFGTMIPNTFIFAYKNKAWVIFNDLSVSEIDDYFTIGSGADVAKGVLFATTKNSNSFERIVMAVQAAAENTLYVDDNIVLLSTEKHKNDAKLMAKAFNISVEQLTGKDDDLKNIQKDKKGLVNKQESNKEVAENAE